MIDCSLSAARVSISRIQFRIFAQRDRKLKILLYAALLSILLCKSAVSQTSSFNEAYTAYKNAQAEKDWDSSLIAAEIALTQGLEIFEEDGENIANLRLNYASELLRSGAYRPASELLVQSLDAKIMNLGQTSIDLIEVLMPLGKSTSTFSKRRAAGYFKQALDLVDADPALSASLRLDAGLSLFAAGEREDARDYLIHAQNYYQQQYGAEDFRAGLAGINLGRLFYETEEYERAELALEEASKAFQASTEASMQFAAAITELSAAVKISKDISDRPSMDPAIGVSHEHLGPRSGDH